MIIHFIAYKCIACILSDLIYFLLAAVVAERERGGEFTLLVKRLYVIIKHLCVMFKLLCFPLYSEIMQRVTKVLYTSSANPKVR